MIRRIRGQKDFYLRYTSDDIDIKSDECKRVITDLMDTYKSINSPKGLSAPQIGESVKVMICRLGKTPVLMINPKIIATSMIRLNSNEGCESVSGRYIVKRPLWLKVAYEDQYGAHTERFCWWQGSRVVQHEYDHLLGKLISDYPSRRWVNLLEARSRKAV